MDEEYDAIICGTGLTECMISGLLSCAGKKVLHVDRNNYYGGDAASLNLTNLWEKFRPGETPPPEFGSNRDWNVDLIPKFVMAGGKLVKILIHTRVTRYLEWQSVDGTFVYQYQKGGMFSSTKYIHKVPANDVEALKSPLMGLLEKNRCKNFFQFVQSFDENNKETWKGINPHTTTMAALYESYGLVDNTIDFLGHAVSLYVDDTYLQRPCGPTLEKMKLYVESIARYGKSPFIYPVYGLGGLPEGFSRLSAIHGGTYMLNKTIDGFEYDEAGKVCGVRSGSEVARAPLVVCDPSYVQGTKKVRPVGRVIRSICILTSPIPETNDVTSAQIIIPQRQLNRKSDIYIMLVSSQHQVCFQGKYIAIVSATIETQDPEKEIQPAYDLLGPIETKFTYVSDMFVPTDDGSADNVFVSRSYDPTSHFESCSEDVLDLYKRISGKELDMSISADIEEE